jgi:hypothetical protein
MVANTAWAASSLSNSITESRTPASRSTSHTPSTPCAAAAAGTTSSITCAMPSSRSDGLSSNLITWAYIAFLHGRVSSSVYG